MVYSIFSFICCFSIVGLCISGLMWYKAKRYCKNNNIELKAATNKLNDFDLIWLKKVRNRKIAFFVCLSIFIVCMIVVASLISVK